MKREGMDEKENDEDIKSKDNSRQDGNDGHNEKSDKKNSLRGDKKEECDAPLIRRVNQTKNKRTKKKNLKFKEKKKLIYVILIFFLFFCAWSLVCLAYSWL